MRQWLRAVVLAQIFLSGALASASVSPRTGAVQETCQQASSETFAWAYCVSRTVGSSNSDVLYYLPGLGTDQHDWNNEDVTQAIRNEWQARGVAAPIVVTVVFSPGVEGLFLLGPKNSSAESGKFDFFVSHVMPTVESALGAQFSGRRLLMGVSMGGFNSIQLLAKKAGLFARATLVCPMIPALSPFASDGDWTVFAQRKGLDMDELNLLREGVKDDFPTQADWKGSDPLNLANSAFGKSTPPIYISWDSEDDFGFDEGAQSFTQTARGRGASFQTEPVQGAHCENLDGAAIADFLGAVLSLR